MSDMRPFVEDEANAAWHEVNKARAERDHWIRLFNRLEGVVAHHRKSDDFDEVRDEALHAAHDRVLRDAAKGVS